MALQVNTARYPDSANTWDSLGEVRLRDGQPAWVLDLGARGAAAGQEGGRGFEEPASGRAERQIRRLSAEPEPGQLR